MSFIDKLIHDFNTCFIVKDRYKYITDGLLNTIKLSLSALIIGIIIGTILAVVRTTYEYSYEEMQDGFKKKLLAIGNAIAKLYITIIRGTPVMIQMMIMFFVIFSFARDGMPIAMLTFGINSGAYVAEIIRGGIMSVDFGQTEAARSLGFNNTQTMAYVVIPQALKNVLPSLCNEFIALLKETSIACYVAVNDLTKGGEIIRSITYIQALPLIVVALCYLIMVVVLTKMVSLLERRLRETGK